MWNNTIQIFKRWLSPSYSLKRECYRSTPLFKEPWWWSYSQSPPANLRMSRTMNVLSQSPIRRVEFSISILFAVVTIAHKITTTISHAHLFAWDTLRAHLGKVGIQSHQWPDEDKQIRLTLLLTLIPPLGFTTACQQGLIPAERGIKE